MRDKVRLSIRKLSSGNYIESVHASSEGTDYIKQELYDKLEAENKAMRESLNNCTAECKDYKESLE